MHRIDFKKIVEGAKDIIYLIDQTGKILYINPATREIIGYEPEELIGTSIFDLMTPDSRRFSYQQFSRRIRGEASEPRYFVDLISKAGELRRCEIYAQLAKKKNGELLVQGIIRDMTSLELLRERLVLSKKRLETIIETAAAIIVEMDLHGRISLVNHSIEIILGYRKDEVIEADFAEKFVPQEARGEFKELMTRVVENGEIVKKTWEIPTKHGKRASILWTFKGFYDQQSKIAGIVAIGEDITSRLEIEKNLRKHNELLKRLNDISVAATSSLSSEEALKASIEIAINFFNFDRAAVFSFTEEMKPKKILSLGDDDRRKVPDYEQIAEEIAEEIIKSNNIIFVSPSEGGKFREKLEDVSSAAFVPIRGRKLNGFFCVCSHGHKEFTPEEKSFFESLSIIIGYSYENIMLYEDLRRSLETLRLYGDIILHDIVNFMMPINAYCEIVNNLVKKKDSEMDDENLQRYASKLMSSVQRLIEFIENVRVLARAIEKKETEMKPINLLAALDKSIEIAKQRYSDANITVEGLDAKSARETFIAADDALPHVFLNIITNALKYSGQQPVSVVLTIDPQRKVAKVAFEDQGPGIPDEYKERIFDRRFSLDTDKAKKGTGIGLAIVQRLVERYGGRVWVEDRIKGDHTKGARFVIELPIA
ncbi:MAG: PAS domain S-box protein [Methanomassiliicoccales archaeon]|jgi:PAS domain S-box-containing protein|nr:PAS domain S-box protein [Methanomassiliicoccales archaeon]